MPLAVQQNHTSLLCPYVFVTRRRAAPSRLRARRAASCESWPRHQNQNFLHLLHYSALRELALKVYDKRAILVEVVSRLDALRSLGGRPLHEQQVGCSLSKGIKMFFAFGHPMNPMTRTTANA